MSSTYTMSYQWIYLFWSSPLQFSYQLFFLRLIRGFFNQCLGSLLIFGNNTWILMRGGGVRLLLLLFILLVLDMLIRNIFISKIIWLCSKCAKRSTKWLGQIVLKKFRSRTLRNPEVVGFHCGALFQDDYTITSFRIQLTVICFRPTNAIVFYLFQK